MSRQDSALLMALLGFVVLFILFGGLGIYFYQKTEALPKEGSPGGMRHRHEEATRDREQYQLQIDELNHKIEELKGKKAEAQVTHDNNAHRLEVVRSDKTLYDIYSQTSLVQVEKQQSIKSEIERFLSNGEDPATREYVAEGLRARRQQKQDEYSRVRADLRARIEDLRNQIAKEDEEATRLLDQLRESRSTLETRLNGAQEELRKFTARERQVINVEPDGSILEADFATKLAVIDIGSSSGVDRGYRFEVFRLMSGVYRVSKGFLEVRSVRAETATCTILERTVELPRCATCGYTARQPEEQYCPYCVGGSSGIGVLRLAAKPKVVTFGMNPENPIATGDSIWNPLFKPGKSMKVLYAGDPLIPGKFSRQFIRNTVEWYGNEIVEDMGAHVDLVVAGRLAISTVEAARELGVDLIYEFELFPFLRR